MSQSQMKRPDLSKLEHSPLFAASLGSKELFHSNLLAFLISRHPSLAKKLFKVDLGENPSIERELNHADLVISGNGQKLVVENKVKDVAGPEQLSEISGRFKDATAFVLLSFLGENIKKEQLGQWREISYQSMIDVLDSFQIEDRYLSDLIRDYLGFVQVIIRELSDLQNCDSYWFYRTDNPGMDVWKKYRLHDLYMKYGLSRFHLVATKALGGRPDVSVETSINNSKPTISFKLKVDAQIVCVQIEDNQYRRAIIGTDTDISKFEEVGWFSSQYVSVRGKNYLQYKEGDGLTFFYQILDRDVKDKKFVELLKMVEDDFSKLRLKQR